MSISINGSTGISGVDGSAATPALQGGDTNTGISFGTDEVQINTGGTQRAVVDASGRLGIGTASPQKPVHLAYTTGTPDASLFSSEAFLITAEEIATGLTATVASDTSTGDRGTVVGTRCRGTLSSPTAVLADDQTFSLLGVAYDGAAIRTTSAIDFVAESDASSGVAPQYIRFSTGETTRTERMRIDSRGNVFLNSAVPTDTIWSNANSVYNQGYVGSNGSFGMDIVGNGYRNTSGGWTSLNRAGQTGRSMISLRPGSGSGGEITFHADNSLTGTEPVQRMKIDAVGNIYSYSAQDQLLLRNSNGAGTARQFISGRYSATSTTGGGSLSFAVYTNGNVQNTNNSYTGISDIKLKENIVDASSQWDDLKALQVRNYNFKEGQTHTQIGLVAQEVELVCPGLVNESPDRDEEGNDLGTVTKSVNYSVLYMKAVKALQEAIGRIETLEAEVQALKGGN